jgi:hypothetical protein
MMYDVGKAASSRSAEELRETLVLESITTPAVILPRSTATRNEYMVDMLDVRRGPDGAFSIVPMTDWTRPLWKEAGCNVSDPVICSPTRDTCPSPAISIRCAGVHPLARGATSLHRARRRPLRQLVRVLHRNTGRGVPRNVQIAVH